MVSQETRSRNGPERSSEMSILVYGYGNLGRTDDGLGPILAEKIEEAGLDNVFVDAAYQPSPEDAADVAEYGAVLFIDAILDGPECFALRKVDPSRTITFSSHIVDPSSVLAICQDVFGRVPEAWLLAVRGYNFDFGEHLTEGGQKNLDAALSFAEFFLSLALRREKGNQMGEKTILIIDDDPDIRSTIRIVLESGGYSVGGASTAEEGLKIANKTKPDAIIVDLMMESIDAGAKLSQQLKDVGFGGPIYLLSSAGDAVRLNLDSRELGLTGIFQKPLDHKVLLNTLDRELRT